MALECHPGSVHDLLYPLFWAHKYNSPVYGTNLIACSQTLWYDGIIHGPHVGMRT